MDKLNVSSSPHIRGGRSTQNIMLDVLIALLPCVIAGTVFFGFRALLVVAVTAASAVLAEYVSRIVMKREQTAQDLSALVSGVILGLILPADCPLVIAAFGSVVAIVVVKQMFGGIGQNFANPACTARIVLLISFSGVSQFSKTVYMADAVTSATPLAAGKDAYSLLDLFIGNTPGCVGETCAAAILLGFVYLLARKVITPTVPLAFIGSAALMALICGQDVPHQLLSGGLLFGAVFMATDYATSPVTFVGKLIFGIGCGIITILIRVYASLPEGVSYAILLMNIISPRLDDIYYARPLGAGKGAAK
jgi:electron transport complex protein RnfD